MLPDWCLNAGESGAGDQLPSRSVGESRITSHNIHRAFNQALHPTIWIANWSSWTSPLPANKVNELVMLDRVKSSASILNGGCREYVVSASD